jgi:hypothetical protein
MGDRSMEKRDLYIPVHHIPVRSFPSVRNVTEARVTLIQWMNSKRVCCSFPALVDCLRQRLDRHGHLLLVLDNVTDSALLDWQQTDLLTVLGPKLHLLATTRLLPPSGADWLTLGELPAADALELLEKHRPARRNGRQRNRSCIGWAGSHWRSSWSGLGC